VRRKLRVLPAGRVRRYLSIAEWIVKVPINAIEEDPNQERIVDLSTTPIRRTGEDEAIGLLIRNRHSLYPEAGW
jgi:hypothetical protein